MTKLQKNTSKTSQQPKKQKLPPKASTTKARELLYQGAEAVVYVQDGLVHKERIAKSYRHPLLDKSLRQSRFRREIKILETALAKGVAVPKVKDSSEQTITIILEKIPGVALATLLHNEIPYAKQLGTLVGSLHAAGIVHGDLTTRNVLVVPDTKKLCLIDFGLSFFSTEAEHRAVDLHVLEEVLTATEPDLFDKIWRMFTEAYGTSFSEGQEVLKRLKVVQARGRHKLKI